MNITYSPELNRAIAFAQEEARGLGHHCVSSAHLLLGLCRTDSIAGNFLRALGVTLPFALPIVEMLCGRREPLPKDLILPLDQMAHDDLALAQSESNRLKSVLCHPEHLLLALFKDPESISAVGILPALGVSLSYAEAEFAIWPERNYDLAGYKQQLQAMIKTWQMRAEMAKHQGFAHLEARAMQHADKYKKQLSDLEQF